jgi:hypothetical protein
VGWAGAPSDAPRGKTKAPEKIVSACPGTLVRYLPGIIISTISVGASMRPATVGVEKDIAAFC